MPTSPSLVSQLVTDLVEGDANRRHMAADRLARLERSELGAAVRPLLVLLGRDPSPMTRNAAAWALVNASPLPTSTLGDLFGALESGHADVRGWACTLLGGSDPHEASVEPTLRGIAERDPDPEVQWRAQVALRELAKRREARPSVAATVA